jgi:hypothetical protein
LRSFARGPRELEQLVQLDGTTAGETLRLAASVDRLSSHPLAHALVAGAEAQGLQLELPRDVTESFGRGVAVDVGGHRVLVGSRSWLSHGIHVRVPERLNGAAKVLVGIDGTCRGRRHRPHLCLLGIDLNELAAGRRRRHQGGTLIPYPDFSIRRTLIYATLALRLARRHERGVVGTLDRTCELDA